MTVVTRIAPSPTGYAHIGTMRTALFNYLFARHHGGKFLLRIEDTDASRNIEEAIQPIADGMRWLGIDFDGDYTRQSHSRDRHVEVAHELLARGAAYRCYLTADEIDRAKKAAQLAKRTFLLRSPWRIYDAQPEDKRDAYLVNKITTEHPPYTIRIKMPQSGETTIDDLVQGTVTVQNETLDDFIILRADGTPTYMLASVVDDHDSGITTVIRGDDHLNNAFRQLGIIRAMRWAEPRYAHIPLILDERGKKLSKRDGAAGIEYYRDKGYLPDAVFNYLLRLGWGHGDHEIFSRDQAIELFDIDAVGRAPARLDEKRMEYLNGVYIRDMTEWDFAMALMKFILDNTHNPFSDGSGYEDTFILTMAPLIQPRTKTLAEAKSYVDMTRERPNVRVDSPYLVRFNELVRKGSDFSPEGLKKIAEQIAEENGVKLKHVVEPIRLAIFGSKVSPPLFDVLWILGHDEVLGRFDFAMTGRAIVHAFSWNYTSYRRLKPTAANLSTINA